MARLSEQRVRQDGSVRHHIPAAGLEAARSQNGGILPRWSADGREIFYLSQDHSTLFAAAVSAEGATFRVLNVQPLFSRQMVAGRGYPYDVTADGSRFLVVSSTGAATSPLTLVLNWDADLRR